MATEWRSNTWLAIELLIISSTVWYIIDFCGTYIRIAMEPIGVDIENCFEVGIRFKCEGSPGYIAHSNEPGDRNSDDLATLTERLRTIGDIEAVTSGSNRPYNYIRHSFGKSLLKFFNSANYSRCYSSCFCYYIYFRSGIKRRIFVHSRYHNTRFSTVCYRKYILNDKLETCIHFSIWI